MDKNAIGRRFADSNHVHVVLSQRLSTVSVGSFVKFSSFELIIQATPLFICSSNFERVVLMIPQKSKLDNRNVDAGSDKIRAVRSMTVQ